VADERDAMEVFRGDVVRTAADGYLAFAHDVSPRGCGMLPVADVVAVADVPERDRVRDRLITYFKRDPTDKWVVDTALAIVEVGGLELEGFDSDVV
jgi:hypothetical protein